MPSKSQAQSKLMRACAHGAKYKSCPPSSVSKEFSKADRNVNLKKLPKKVKKSK